MNIRRPLAGLFVAVTLFGGGGAALAGCSDPVNAPTGTSKDSASDTTAGTNPSDRSQGNLPDNSNREPSSSRTKGGVGGGDQDGG
jgi:hypothetical protein